MLFCIFKTMYNTFNLQQYLETAKWEEDVEKEELSASEMMGCVTFSHEECLGVRVWLCHSRNAELQGLASCLCYVCVGCTASSCQIL